MSINLKIVYNNPKSGLIFTPFVNGSSGCFDLANNLTNTIKSPVKFYSGSKPKNFNAGLDFDIYKKNIQQEYKQNKFSLLTATKAFGMGINKKNIIFTVHYGLPASMESLYQEAGRAGSDRSPSKCYVLLTKENLNDELSKLFNPNSSYEEIKATVDNVGWNGKDVFKQMFLYLNGLDSVSEELDLVVKLHDKFSTPKGEVVVFANSLGSNKAKVEKAIYRLSNLGIVLDWTVDDFFDGIFTVTYSDYSESTIQVSLLNFINKYIDDFKFDDNESSIKYTDILNDINIPLFSRLVKILLQWSYDKFGAGRRESLKNVYENCLNYDDSIEGKDKFKKSLESYFKFTEATYVLQHIAENNNKDISKWFEVFYDENNVFISEDALLDLKGNLQRFLESFQSNTGLNLINGLTILILNENLSNSIRIRFNKSFEIINSYEDSKYDYIIDQILEISKSLSDKSKMVLLKILYKYCKNEDDKLRFAKTLVV